VLDPSRKRYGGRNGRGPSPSARRRGGFTLVELIVVVVIVGIILALMLTASMNAARSAQEKATQSLIAKLDAAFSDRVDAILQTRVSEPTATQVVVSQIYDGQTPLHDPIRPPRATPANPNPQPPPSLYAERAYVLAQIELFQRETPDVFFIQDIPDSASEDAYPLNFAANPYPIVNGSPNAVVSAAPALAKYVLPLGTGWPYNEVTGSNYFNPGQGIYGASYHAAAGVYKNLGYLPTGYDGVDNDGDGLVDEWNEGVNADNLNLVQTNLKSHQHKTARAEMLYALLVESQGPFGSIFNRDEFTDREVQDTDGDGLPEFVDAWGEPLQFYRWPLLFSSELQKGQKLAADPSTGIPVFAPPYADMIEQREVDPLDPNQQLMSAAWWSTSYNNAVYVGRVGPNWPFPPGFSTNSTGQWGPGVTFFENYFHPLHEPLYKSAPIPGQFWDRGAPGTMFASRRAFTSKFLIVSSGPDKELGLFQYDDAGLAADLSKPPDNGSRVPAAYRTAFPLLGMESLAAPLSYPDLFKLTSVTNGGGASLGDPVSSAPTAQHPLTSLDIQARGQDDIHNHSIPAGGIGGSAP
jgi:prepilin-type N-terminal cleavage/methylation domain-containing protein